MQRFVKPRLCGIGLCGIVKARGTGGLPPARWQAPDAPLTEPPPSGIDL